MVSLVVLPAPVAGAQAVTFTGDTTIGCTDPSYDGYHVVVDGATLTVDCFHTFQSLELKNGAMLTHGVGQLEGLELSVTGDLRIDATSVIDVTGRGHGPDEGPGAGEWTPHFWAGGGGGGHAGRGGDATAAGGGCYGSILDPATPGSGGGCSYFSATTAGGGVVRLHVGGSLLVDGEILADGIGMVSSSGGADGGGAGGSIAIEAGILTGAGTIAARGGDSVYSGTLIPGGGGGGGRIAVRCGTDAFTGSLSARGGKVTAPGAFAGGAGTIYRQTLGEARGVLRMDNEGNPGAMTQLAVPLVLDGDLLLLGGARLSPLPQERLVVEVTGDLTIDAQSAVDADSLGHLPDDGPGAGAGSIWFTVPGTGGGHGGVGGGNAPGVIGGNTYGSPLLPVHFGSGGGSSFHGFNGGVSYGGGAVGLTAGAVLRIDGRIGTDGFAYDNTGGGAADGGGAGGSVLLQAGSIEGTGVVSARGADSSASGGGSLGGGGGGGRVALYAQCASSFPVANIDVQGGSGFLSGDPGSVHVEVGSGAFGKDCTGLTVLPLSSDLPALALAAGGTLQQQLNALNAGPPPLSGAGWVPVARRSADGDEDLSHAFECGAVADPLAEAYVSADEYLDGDDEVTLDNCGSAFYRFTFHLPPDFAAARLQGVANVDDQGVVFLNGVPISGLMTVPACEPDPAAGAGDGCYALQDAGNDLVDAAGRPVLTWPTLDPFETLDTDLFVAGENELVFAVCGNASFFEPTGLEFRATVTFSESPGTTFGTGCPGSGGLTPWLALGGTTAGGGQVTLSIGNALGGTVALLFFGDGPGAVPIADQCQLNIFPLLSGPFPVSLAGQGAGEGTFNATFPVPAVPSAVTAALTALVADPGAAPGFSQTNGVAFTLY